MHYAITQYGFEYGAGIFERECSDEKQGWVQVSVKSKLSHDYDIHIYITKTGRIKVFDADGRRMMAIPHDRKHYPMG